MAEPGDEQGQYLSDSLKNIIDLFVSLEKIIAPPKDYLHCTQKARLGSIENLLLHYVLNCSNTQRYDCLLFKSPYFSLCQTHCTGRLSRLSINELNAKAEQSWPGGGYHSSWQFKAKRQDISCYFTLAWNKETQGTLKKLFSFEYSLGGQWFWSDS